MIDHALSVLSVQAQVSTYCFLLKNLGNSYFCGGRPQKTLCFTCPERRAARLDALEPSKSIEIIEAFSDISRILLLCDAIERIRTRLRAIWRYLGVILGSFWRRLGSFWDRLGAILESSGVNRDAFH